MIEDDSLCLKEVVHTIGGHLTAEPRLLKPSEGRVNPNLEVVIDGDHSCLEFGCDLVALRTVLGEYRPDQTVWCIVRSLDHLVNVRELEHRVNLAENLLPHYLHVIVTLSENSGLNEKAGSIDSVAAADKLSAFVFATLDVREHFVKLVLADNRPTPNVWLVKTSVFLALEHTDEVLNELIVHFLMDEKTSGRCTELACVDSAVDFSADCGFHKVSVVKHDQGIFATELETDSFHGFCCSALDSLADCRAACEVNRADVRVVNDCFTGFSADARYHIYDSRHDAIDV